MAETPLIPPAPVVSLSGFGKTYKKVIAAKDVSFQVQPGTLYGLLGPDGAGKSSVLKAIAGVLTYEEGSLDVFGSLIDSERAGERIKGRLGFMPQGLGLNLYQELTVDENVDFFADLRLIPRDRYVQKKRELFEITRLSEFRDRKMRHLSGGMKQKLGLVCALIHDPELLILDEPTTGVDPVSRRDFWTILSRQIHERGITAIVSTAYMDEASRFDRICVLHECRQLAEGPPAEVIGKLPGTVVSLKASDQVLAMRNLRAEFPRADVMGDRIRVRVDAKPEAAVAAVNDALHGASAEEPQVEEPTLEDTFVFMLGGQSVAEEGHGGYESVSREANGRRAAETGDAVAARRLTKRYDGFVAVDRVNLTVRRGEIFGLLGANGAGKTTVIKMLTGIVQPSWGVGHVAGADMRRASMEVKRRIGYVSQAYSLYQDLTVVENILLYAGIYGLKLKDARDRAKWVVAFGGLQGHENTRSGSLPLGLRQRLALGCALVHSPQVLFLDEPTSGVDPIGRRAIWQLLFELAREHDVAVLVTTHYMSEAEHCDQLALMHAGKVVAAGSPGDLKEAFREESGTVIEVLCDDLSRGEGALSDAGLSPTLFGRYIHCMGKDVRRMRETMERVLNHASVGILSLREVDTSMEDVFVSRITQLERESPGEEAIA